MHSDFSAIGVRSLISLLTIQLLMIQSGFLELGIRSVLCYLNEVLLVKRKLSFCSRLM
uniref:Uncharacterized protein n=1 Tax=Solanum lycopersicum TaxID=4081 RepID=A0A3Q7GG65_SOLLC